MRLWSTIFVPLIIGSSVAKMFAQDRHPWGDTYSCPVDWFDRCGGRPDEPVATTEKTAVNLQSPRRATNLPDPIRNVIENPSPKTARAYVLWSRQARERLGRASEYIAEANRDIDSEASVSQNGDEETTDLALEGVGPVGLYYFFSPDDQSAANDVAVLNKIWHQGRIGVVGIPVHGGDDELARFLRETKPLFPVRRSNAEVQMINPVETPELHLALPLQKKIYSLGSVINKVAIMRTIGNLVTPQVKGRAALDSAGTGR